MQMGSLPFPFSPGGWGALAPLGTRPFLPQPSSSAVISAFLSQLETDWAHGSRSARWSVNEERAFCTCWIRGEGLDPLSMGKKTELEESLFWGQQLPLLLSLLQEWSQKGQVLEFPSQPSQPLWTLGVFLPSAFRCRVLPSPRRCWKTVLMTYCHVSNTSALGIAIYNTLESAGQRTSSIPCE